MSLKDKINNTLNTLNEHFIMPFLISVSTLFLIISIFKLTVFNTDSSVILYTGLIFGFIVFFLWFKKLDEDNKIKIVIIEFCSHIFLISLFFITLSNFDFFIKINPILINKIDPFIILISIFSGFITFYLKGKKIREYNNKEYYHKYFFISILLIFIIFILIKLLMPILHDGSYIDEYYHISTGLDIFKNHQLSQFNYSQPYDRGVGISFLVGLFLNLISKSIFVAKLIPAVIGIGSFIFLYLIAKKILSKIDIIFLLLIYSINIGTLLNHFYIRFFCIYELFILIITYLFLSINKLNFKNRIKTIFLLNVILLLISRDNGAYMIVIFSIILIFIYSLTNGLLKIKNLLFLFRQKSKPLKLLLILTPIILLFYLLVEIRIQDKIIELFSYTNKTVFSSNLIGYWKLFFKYNLIFSIPLIIFFFHIIFKKKYFWNNFEVLFISFSTIFILHLISSREIQLFRGIFYLLPLYYLLSFACLSKNIANKIIKIIIYILFIFSTVLIYPKDFFKIPTIPNESVYLGGQIYSEIRNNCKDSLIISSQYPYVLSFYNIETDYYIQENIQIDIESGYIILDSTENRYYTNYQKTPMITNLNELKEVVNKNKKICYLERSPVVRVWLNKDTLDYIKNNFKLLKDDVNQKLYIKN